MHTRACLWRSENDDPMYQSSWLLCLILALLFISVYARPADLRLSEGSPVSTPHLPITLRLEPHTTVSAFTRILGSTSDIDCYTALCPPSRLSGP